MNNTWSKRPTLHISWAVEDEKKEWRALVPVTANSLPSKALSPHVCKAFSPNKLSMSRPTNTISVGNRLRLELQSDIDGYLTIFDFMTSGRFAKLFPCPKLSTVDNHIEGGKNYAAPGELLPIPAFRVSGPTTAESGRLERLLVIVTRNPVNLSESAILNAGTAFATRGGIGSVEESVASLLDLPEEEWSYGLLETEIV